MRPISLDWKGKPGIFYIPEEEAGTVMKTLGLICQTIVKHWGEDEESFGYEACGVIEAGREIYGSVALINPRLMSIELPRGGTAPVLFHDGRPLLRIDSLMVRSSVRLGDGLAATIRCLKLVGCDILDPLTRQGGKPGTKLLTSINRFEGRVGSSTYLAFSRRAAEEMAQRLAAEDRFPLIGKPIDGHGGKGVVRLDTKRDVQRYIADLYSRNRNATILLQPFEAFAREFRVVVFFGEPLGIALKQPARGSVAANAAQGGVFVQADRPDVIDYVLQNTDETGILGVDVGEKQDGELRIIEANRAPKWEAFDKALGCNTAREIVKRARARLDRTFPTDETSA
jgi:hypothetical protein